MADSTSSTRRPLAHRLWWVYLLTAAVFFIPLAIWLALEQRPRWPLYVILLSLLGLTNIVMGVGFWRERRRQ